MLFRSLVKGRFQPPPHVAVLVDAVGDAVDLEPSMVVMLKQPRHQERGGVDSEIGGQVGDADPVVPPRLAVPERLRRCGDRIGDIPLRGSQLRRPVAAVAKQHEGRHRRIAAGDTGVDFRREARTPLPVADAMAQFAAPLKALSCGGCIVIS